MTRRVLHHGVGGEAMVVDSCPSDRRSKKGFLPPSPPTDLTCGGPGQWLGLLARVSCTYPSYQRHTAIDRQLRAGGPCCRPTSQRPNNKTGVFFDPVPAAGLLASKSTASSKSARPPSAAAARFARSSQKEGSQSQEGAPRQLVSSSLSFQQLLFELIEPAGPLISIKRNMIAKEDDEDEEKVEGGL